MSLECPDRSERYIELLDQQVEMSANLMQRVHDRAVSEDDPVDGQEFNKLAEIFERLTTGLRRAILLIDRLRKAIAAKPPRPLRPASDAATPETTAAATRARAPPADASPERLDRPDPLPRDAETLIADIQADQQAARAVLDGAPVRTYPLVGITRIAHAPRGPLRCDDPCPPKPQRPRDTAYTRLVRTAERLAAAKHDTS